MEVREHTRELVQRLWQQVRSTQNFLLLLLGCLIHPPDRTEWTPELFLGRAGCLERYGDSQHWGG